VLTEERRRRIHAARQVYENAQTLKSFKSTRGYHGSVAIESFEEQLSQHEDTFWLPSNVARYRNRRDSITEEREVEIEENQRQTELDAFLGKPPAKQRTTHSTISTLQPLEATARTHQSTPFVDVPRAVSGRNATHIATQSSTQSDLNTSGVAEESYVEQLQSAMKQIRARSTSDDPTEMNVPMLQEVVDLFLARTAQTTSETPFSNQMVTIGQRLCQDTFLAKRYELTEKVFERLEAGRGRRKTTAVAYLIRAQHALGEYEQCLVSYQLYHNQMRWHQTAFYDVGTCIVEGLLSIGNIEAVKSFLHVAANTASDSNLQMSSTWILKILGRVHRKHLNIDLTRQTFEGFIPLLSRVAHPHALYSAMMQFCIESNRDSLAEDYYNRLMEAHPTSWKDIHISGHLIWLKARRGDWKGVTEDLTELHYQNRRRSPYQEEKFNSLFIPIMKAHMEAHDTAATEAFLMSTLKTCQLQVTNHLSNLMVSMYVTRNDIDSLMRWLEFSSANHVNIGPVTINTLLCKLAKTHDLVFGETMRLYHRFRNLGRQLGIRLVDAATLHRLEHLAIQTGRHPGERLSNLSQLSSSKVPVMQGCVEVSEAQEAEKEMWRLHETGEFAQCLSKYQELENNGSKPSTGMLKLAVSSQLKIEGDHLGDAKNILRKAHTSGVDTSEAISVMMVAWIQRLEDQQHKATFIAEKIYEEIRALSDAGLEPSQNVLVQTISLLVKHQKSQAAIDFWHATARFRNQSTSQVDLSTLTSLLKAYMRLRNERGIQWCVSMLGHNDLYPDHAFYHAMKQECNQVRKNLQGVYGQNYQNVVFEMFHEVKRLKLLKSERKAATVEKTFRGVEKSANLQAGRQASQRVDVVQYRVQDNDPGAELFDENFEVVVRQANSG